MSILFEEIQELSGKDEAAAWMIPPHESFQAVHFMPAKVEQGLVVKSQVAVLERLMQVRPKREACR